MHFGRCKLLRGIKQDFRIPCAMHSMFQMIERITMEFGTEVLPVPVLFRFIIFNLLHD